MDFLDDYYFYLYATTLTIDFYNLLLLVLFCDSGEFLILDDIIIIFCMFDTNYWFLYLLLLAFFCESGEFLILDDIIIIFSIFDTH